MPVRTGQLPLPLVFCAPPYGTPSPSDRFADQTLGSLRSRTCNRQLGVPWRTLQSSESPPQSQYESRRHPFSCRMGSMVMAHSISGLFVASGMIESNCCLLVGGGVIATRLGNRLTCSGNSPPVSCSQILYGPPISRCRAPPDSVSRRHWSLETHHSMNVPFLGSRSSPMNENSTFSRNAGASLWRISETARARDIMASPRDCTVCAVRNVVARTANIVRILDADGATLYSTRACNPLPATLSPAALQSSCPDQSPIRR